MTGSGFLALGGVIGLCLGLSLAVERSGARRQARVFAWAAVLLAVVGVVL